MLPGKMRTATPTGRGPGAHEQQARAAGTGHNTVCVRAACRRGADCGERWRRAGAHAPRLRHDLSTRAPSPPELIALLPTIRDVRRTIKMVRIPIIWCHVVHDE